MMKLLGKKRWLRGKWHRLRTISPTELSEIVDLLNDQDIDVANYARQVIERLLDPVETDRGVIKPGAMYYFTDKHWEALESAIPRIAKLFDEYLLMKASDVERLDAETEKLIPRFIGMIQDELKRGQSANEQELKTFLSSRERSVFRSELRFLDTSSVPTEQRQRLALYLNPWKGATFLGRMAERHPDKVRPVISSGIHLLSLVQDRPWLDSGPLEYLLAHLSLNFPEEVRPALSLFVKCIEVAKKERELDIAWQNKDREDQIKRGVSNPPMKLPSSFAEEVVWPTLALGEVGDFSAIEPLRSLLNDEESLSEILWRGGNTGSAHCTHIAWPDGARVAVMAKSAIQRITERSTARSISQNQPSPVLAGETTLPESLYREPLHEIQDAKTIDPMRLKPPDFPEKILKREEPVRLLRLAGKSYRPPSLPNTWAFCS